MKRKSKKIDISFLLVYILITMYVLSLIFVLAFGVLNSLKYWVDFNRGNIFGLPSSEYGWRFDNYAQTFKMFYVSIKPVGQRPRNVYMIEMFWNTVTYATLMSVFSILTQVMVAYTVSKYDFKLGKIIYSVAIIVMLIPIVGALASQVRVAQVLGLNNSLLGVCIMNCKYPGLYFLVFYAAFKGIPWTYAEAAQLDGANDFTIFIRIMLPMVMSTIGAVFLLYFIQFWNEYYTPMIFLPEKPTISYGLYLYQNNVQTSMSTPLKLAASILSCVPVILLFVLFRNIIMNNVTVGGIKG